MEIRNNKSRISVWYNKKRYCKIELKKLTFTNTYSKNYKDKWIIYKFDDLNTCINYIKIYFNEKNINFLENEINLIKQYYKDLLII